MIRQRALQVVLALVGLLFTAAIYPAIGGLCDPAHSDTGDTMQMALYTALGIFLLLAVRNPAAHRQPDRFRGLVELCPRGSHVGAGIRNAVRTRRIFGGLGSARRHWRRADRAGSGEAVCRPGIGIRGIGVSSARCQTKSDFGSRLRRGCVPSENEVARFDGLVAREAGFEVGLGVRLAVFELSEPPAARRGVLF